MSEEVEEESFATGQGGQASGGMTASGTADFVSRDRDPPPQFSGDNPETTFRSFEKAVRLWQWETDIPERKQGAKLLRALSGTAKLAVEDMEFDEVATTEGVKNIMTKLREFYKPHLEIALPKAFETALYGQVRQQKSFVEYVTRMDRNFVNLGKEGVTLPDGAVGYIIYRQSKLDKVVKDKPKSTYFGDHGEEDKGIKEDADEESDGEHVYLAEGDLNKIYEEPEIVEALASYREVRQALKDQKKGRGFFPAKSFGKGGFGGGKSKSKTRVHVEQLKLRTRCWNCDRIGHWSNECREPRRKDGLQGGSSQGGSSSTSSKTGFFVATPHKVQEPQNNFWLREFVQERRDRLEQAETSDSVEEAYKERRDGTWAWEHGSEKSSTSPLFCGIVTQACEGVVDTAAEGGLIGTQALSRLQTALGQLGYQCKWTPKQTMAKGVGGSAQTIGVILIPLGLGGVVNGVLEATVVEGDIPLLLPVTLLRALHVQLDFSVFTFTMPQYKTTIPMNSMQSGHVTVVVTDFTDGGFNIPEGVGKSSDFQIGRHDNRDVQPEAYQPVHHAKRAFRGWRVILDKIGMLLQLVALQGAMQEWCLPQPAVLECSKSSEKAETLEDYYYEVIKSARVLAPLKAKDGPMVAARSEEGSVESRSWCGGTTSNQRAYEDDEDARGDRRSLHEHGQHGEEPGRSFDRRPDHEVRGKDQRSGQADAGLSGCIITPRGGASGEHAGGVPQDDHGAERAWSEARGDDANADDKSERAEQLVNNLKAKDEVDESKCGGSEHGLEQGSNVQVPETCREVGSEEGGPKEGPRVLEMRAERMQLLCMGAEAEEQEPEEIRRRHGRSVMEEGDGRRSVSDELRRGEGSEGALEEEEMDGQWVVGEGKKARSWVREAQRQRRGDHVDGYFQALEVYYEKSEDGTWSKRSGLIEKDKEGEFKAKVALTSRGVMSDSFEIAKETAFRSKQRRKLISAFNNVVVSEVYSPPRVVPEAEKRGFAPGTSFDLETGWDLLEIKDEAEMWKRLEEEDPTLIVLSHPCTPFSQLQEWNFARMEFDKACRMQAIGLRHMRLATRIAEWQVARGKYFVYEQPLGAKSWKEPEGESLVNRFGRVRCDMCQFGLNVDGTGPNKKPTGILSNSQEILDQVKYVLVNINMFQHFMDFPRKPRFIPRLFVEA
eukprot:symbB.v1.2.037631.t1/scaffold5609.1/size25375/3